MRKGVKKMEIKIVVPRSLWHKLYYFYNAENFKFFFNKFWRLNLWEDFFENILEYMWNIVN